MAFFVVVNKLNYAGSEFSIVKKVEQESFERTAAGEENKMDVFPQAAPIRVVRINASAKTGKTPICKMSSRSDNADSPITEPDSCSPRAALCKPLEISSRVVIRQLGQRACSTGNKKKEGAKAINKQLANRQPKEL
ncbi:hypothetical protein TcasGA2_TC009564 [Tribolium castaneum]|uniref:Uncharacterized protein n=1 Tax=Tribolium castaneum TaxID=7070 RepID=D6WSH1_TRICA|nr:hypothetical protein TcasGA2_TC009564 [Tribolium castaneum]